jgi:hypothetical protein
MSVEESGMGSAEVNMTINAIKCKDAVIFSPHPLNRNTGLRELYAALTVAVPPVAMVRSQIDISSWASGCSVFQDTAPGPPEALTRQRGAQHTRDLEGDADIHRLASMAPVSRIRG